MAEPGLPLWEAQRLLRAALFSISLPNPFDPVLLLLLLLLRGRSQFSPVVHPAYPMNGSFFFMPLLRGSGSLYLKTS